MLQNHIMGSYYRIILPNDIMKLYYGIIFMKRIPNKPGTFQELPGIPRSPRARPRDLGNAPGTPGHALGTPRGRS